MTDREICEWVADTCLKFGARIDTAYKVAGLFIEGLILSRSKTAT